MTLYYNLHTHSKNDDRQEVRLVNHFLQDNFEPEENVFYSVGIHPWHVALNGGDFTEALGKVASHLQVIAIGECGLDRAIEMPIEEQLPVFEKHILLSESLQIPLIIHCVKAYDMLLPVRRRLKAKQCWILHGYKGNEQTNASFLQDPGIYFSYGKWLFNEKSGFPAIFVQLPLERIFLETDTSDYHIREVYNKAAELRNVPEGELIKQISQSFKKVFGDVGKSVE